MTSPLDPSADFDLRLVRYFLAVAEHRNLGRAAAALHVAQPSLGRQLQRLEDQLGVHLLKRTRHGTQLTEAGEAFLPHAQELLATAHVARRSAKAAAAPPTVTLGYTDDFIVTPVVRDLRRQHPDADIRTRHLRWNDTTALPEHRVDALVSRLPFPFPADDLHVTVLRDEPRVLVVSTEHPLSAKDSVGVADLAEEPVVPCTGPTTTWREFWRLEPRPDGVPAPLTPPLADSYEDKLELVAEGQAVAVLPLGDCRIRTRPDLTTVPIEGIAPCQIVVATRGDDENPLLPAVHRAAVRHLSAA
ncbi:LysR family transcriptional regulator [Amycolatopsis sp. WGS_07]|uniref:LysR family transcriptional regulator n=1 Tax=Amycolatopsis sp. WGS_07 TaxID=3076764 RepID=UPI003873B58C